MDRRLQPGFVFRGGAPVVSHCPPKLFDARVAWLSAALFAGSNLYWKFTVSGLSTSWLVVVFLAAVLGLVRLAGAGMAGRGWVRVAGVGRSGRGVDWRGGTEPLRVRLDDHSGAAVHRMGGAARTGSGFAAPWPAAAFLIVLGPWIARNVAWSAALVLARPVTRSGANAAISGRHFGAFV
jgi:hypothetical protein